MKIKRTSITLRIISFCAMSYFYLLDTDATLFGFSYEDIGLLIVLFWCLYWIYELLQSRNKPKLNSGIWFMTTIFLVVTSSFQGMYLYGQSFLVGIRAQRTLIVYSLIYFATIYYLHRKKITSDDLRKVLYKVSVVQLILFLAQYVLVDVVQFLHVTISEQQRGTRIYYLPIMIDMLFIFSLDDFAQRKGRKRLIYAILIVFSLIEVMVVQKFRMTTIGLVIIGILFFLLMRGTGRQKAYWFAVGMFAVGILYNINFVREIIETILENQDINLRIREQGRAYYVSSVIENPLFAGGYPHSSSASAIQASGVLQNILLVDNGLFGLMFMYGGVGIMWFVTLWIKQIVYGWRLRKWTNRLEYILFPLFFLITGFSEAHWYWEFGMAVLALFNVMQDLKYNEIRNGEMTSKVI